MLENTALKRIMNMCSKQHPGTAETVRGMTSARRCEMHTQYTVKSCGVYKLTSPDGRCYIGSSVWIEARLRNHWQALVNNKHYNGRLQRAWNEYKHFDFEIVERCARTELKEREQAWMDELQSYLSFWGFNIERQTRNKPQSIETRHRISEGNKGRRMTIEQRIKLSEAHKGKRRTVEARRKQSESMRGHTITDETIRKISESNLGKHHGPWSDEQRTKFTAAMTGHAVTEETRRKIGEANTGKKRNEEFRLRQSRLMSNKPGFRTGQICSEETRTRISIAKSNPSEETRRRMSEAARKRWARKHEEQS